MPPIAELDTSVLFPTSSRVLLRRLASNQPALFSGIWSRQIVRELWRTFELRGERRRLALEEAQHLATAALYPLRQVLSMVDAEHRHRIRLLHPYPIQMMRTLACRTQCKRRIDRQPQYAALPASLDHSKR